MFNNLNSCTILEASKAVKIGYPRLLKAVKSGELPAFNTSYGTERPRYRVYTDDLAEYAIKYRASKAKKVMA